MEYIKVDPDEQLLGKRQLLHSQMEILAVMQKYQKYKALRKEELALKTLFKKKVNELTEEVKILDKLVPKVHMAPQIEVAKAKIEADTKKRFDLEAEIEAIKRRIESLH